MSVSFVFRANGDSLRTFSSLLEQKQDDSGEKEAHDSGPLNRPPGIQFNDVDTRLRHRAKRLYHLGSRGRHVGGLHGGLQFLLLDSLAESPLRLGRSPTTPQGLITCTHA